MNIEEVSDYFFCQALNINVLISLKGGGGFSLSKKIMCGSRLISKREHRE